jgi:hypothetical protein
VATQKTFRETLVFDSQKTCGVRSEICEPSPEPPTTPISKNGLEDQNGQCDGRYDSGLRKTDLACMMGSIPQGIDLQSSESERHGWCVCSVNSGEGGDVGRLGVVPRHRTARAQGVCFGRVWMRAMEM